MNIVFETTLEDSFNTLYADDFFQTDAHSFMGTSLSEDSLIFHKPRSLGGFDLGEKHRRILVNQFARKAPYLQELDKFRLIDVLSLCPSRERDLDLDAVTPIILDHRSASHVAITKDNNGFRLEGLIGRAQMGSPSLCIVFFHEQNVYLYRILADELFIEAKGANPTGLVGDLLRAKDLHLDDSQRIAQVKLSEADYHQLMRQARMDLMSFSLGYCHTLLSLCKRRLIKKKQFGKHLHEHQYLRLNYASLLAQYTVFEQGYHGSNYPNQGLDAIKSLLLAIFRTTVHIHGCHGLTEESAVYEFFAKTTDLSERINKVVSDGN
ncbi:Acyl-CoA/acyl-ACP dehydrogenase [Vibrio crassostreae]|nr:Acyl-CoA/acyl-ACP dehydrogenase [Vibrio crassostreae]CAK3060893.1 Acyl-CoA/acyl-ACP dehydrogenase [Vibrio crassostreae]CAK3070280.1 Acyl-CoA/acyl-ACP dehydrogenase [Vibrio crassostreae]CAK3072205.1 Acyl-CoA/acyl-ACP dehydrogenase [Vibrio crassostreae]CAK3072468.1 Acyl-CoA/acyl-ACP dehydrogenase [Vibrio crassostreae]